MTMTVEEINRYAQVILTTESEMGTDGSPY